MRILRRSIAAVAPAFLLAACGGGGSTGTISLKLTDAPGDFQAAVVTISRIEIVGEGGATVLRDTPVTTNLLSLSNDVTDLVRSAVVPSGTYSQLRFVIAGAYVEVEQAGGGSAIYASSPTYEGLPAGATVAGGLKMPSFAESGLKVDLPGGGLKVGTDSRVLLVDFDVAQSFGHEAGDSGTWVMHPVVKAIELELSGTADVTMKLGPGVTLPGTATLADFKAVLTNAGGSAKTLILSDRGGGTFGATFSYLIPGTYTLGFTAAGVTAFTTDPPMPATIVVASGQATVASFALTSAH